MADPQDYYQLVLDDLMARRAKLDAGIAAIQEAMGITGPPNGSAAVGANGAGSIRSDSFFGMTVHEAAKKFLTMSKRTKTAQEIADALVEGGYTFATGNPLGTVSTVLHRADAKGGEIVRVSKGTYGLSEWYPGRPKKKKGADKGSTSAEIDDEPDEGGDAIAAAESAALKQAATP